MLEYNQNSIEKAYVLSYTNPSPGNINQWSQAQHDNVGILMYKFFVSIVALLLKLPRVVHYLFVYIILIVVLTGTLGVSYGAYSNGPYLTLICICGMLLILLTTVYTSSLDFLSGSVRPSSAGTDNENGESLFDDQISDGEKEEIMREMERRATQTKMAKARACICCGEDDDHMLHAFNQIKGSVNIEGNDENSRSRICSRCANIVCQNCRKSDTQKILKLERGDGFTMCVDCVDNVCRNCKSYFPSKDMLLRHSQHGRSVCKKCKLIEDLHKGSSVKKEQNKLRMKNLLSSPTSNTVTAKSLGLKNLS